MPSPEPETYQNTKGQVHVRCKLTVKCAWSDRLALWNWLYSQDGCALAEVPRCLVRRVVPKGHGRYSGTASTPAFTEAIVTIYYDTDGPQWVNDRFVETQIVPAPIRVFPPSGLYWSTGGKDAITAEEASHPTEFTGLLYLVTEGMLTAEPASLYTSVGYTNKSSFPLLDYSESWPAGTVRYEAPMKFCHNDYSASKKYTVGYRWLINPFGWNKAWRASTGEWAPFYNKNGTQIYPYPETWER